MHFLDLDLTGVKVPAAKEDGAPPIEDVAPQASLALGLDPQVYHLSPFSIDFLLGYQPTFVEVTPHFWK